MMYKRHQERSVLHGLQVRRVILLSGARQCGKFTLAQNLPLEGLEYRTLDNATLRSYALSDPEGFVQHKSKILVIDEVQRAPDLLAAIKAKVDGMMSSLLGWNLDQIYLDADRSGKLIETFVFNELSAQIDYQKGIYKLFHYRDHQKREIDFIIERQDGALLCLEVKAGSTVGFSDFKHLIWFKENIAKKHPCLNMILYAGERLIAFGPDLLAVPISALWS